MRYGGCRRGRREGGREGGREGEEGEGREGGHLTTAPAKEGEK